MDTIIVPVGGAGLIAGVAVAVKNLKPDINIIVRIMTLESDKDFFKN